ncbi:MAG: superoxide dismutase family protein [bacterium]|nr:superoxide dismutase family protein [bacterium]
MSLTLHSDQLKETMSALAQVKGPGVDGKLELTEFEIQTAKYVKLKLEVSGDPAVLLPGIHAVHFHEKAACDCDGFKCAGGHFDPGPAGNADPDANHGYHAGDLPSIIVDETGHGLLEAITTRVTLSDGPVSLLGKDSAPDGTSIMIHANADPHTPGESGSGHSGGARLACGTIIAN